MLYKYQTQLIPPTQPIPKIMPRFMEDTLKYTDTSEKARHAKRRDVGRRLRLLRKKFGLSQEEMSEKFRISMRYLSLLETGNKIPDGLLLVAIESVLMVDRRWLVTGKG